MSFINRGRGVVARHYQNIWLEIQYHGKKPVYFFDDFDFGIEIAIFSIGISLFYVDIKEVVLGEVILEHPEFRLYILTGKFRYLHAHQTSYAAIHGIYSYGQGSQAKPLLH
ncbi:MAG: hypothetical protein DDT18_01457 [Actinobacteria bacterium]|nr:hypothetical protein [Actinomycetota bacterium]